MNSGTVFASVLCALLLLPLPAGLAFAEPPGDRPPDGRAWTPPEERLERQLRELGLDSSQLDKTHAILVEARRAGEKTEEQMRKAFDEMRALLEADLPDEAAVMRQEDRIGAIRTEGHKAMLRALLAVRAELNAEQRQKLNEKMRREGPPGPPGMFRHRPGAPREPGPAPGQE